eukprot:TRINITY_DN61010_c0_g1_i1.p1 TRINITY_DN61010_c0_g1~~TRINITY_DN61010_c0_g1_i1.p1  ORF type:complete len:284 (+),score=74.00 TRINITY_DN61010_c0_g1_i1:83-934(+)
MAAAAVPPAGPPPAHNWWDAVRSGDANAVRAQLAADAGLRDAADPNARGPSGRRAIHEAAGLGHGAVVSALLESGAGPAEPDNYGRTPVMLAAALGRGEVLRTLLAALSRELSPGEVAGAVSRSDREGQTALHYAATAPVAQCVRQLLAHGAAPGVVGKQGLTPLELARTCGNGSTVELELRRDLEARRARHQLFRSAVAACFAAKVAAARAADADWHGSAAAAAIPQELLRLALAYLVPDPLPTPPSPAATATRNPRAAAANVRERVRARVARRGDQGCTVM